MTEASATLAGSIIMCVPVIGGWFLANKRAAHRQALIQQRHDAAQSERDKQCLGFHAEHKERLDKHDEKFERMHKDYVPRTELQASMEAIRESANRQERWLEFLVKKEAMEPKI